MNPQAESHGGAPQERASRSCCSDDCCASESVSRAPAPSPESAGRSCSPDRDDDRVRSAVRAGYAKIAESGGLAGATEVASPTAADDASSSGCCGAGGGTGRGGGCCGASSLPADDLVRAIGYSSDELAAIPNSANMGLSCGNPIAISSLRAGEVVLDLGSGGGFDCFVAGPKVGANGRVIGVDMTPEMLSKARANIRAYRERTGLDNVEFRLGEIEHLPVADASVDVVISNCVINLSPDKPAIWREISRVLRPGGRVAVSDLSLLRPLPPEILQDVVALIGCVAGAVLVEETRRMVHAAGLVDIELTPKPEYIDAMTHWEDPLYRRIISALPAGSRTSDFITSLDVRARKAMPR